MSPLDPRAIIERANEFVEQLHPPLADPVRRCFLHGAIEMLKRLQGDTTPEPWSEDYDHEARLRGLLEAPLSPATQKAFIICHNPDNGGDSEYTDVFDTAEEAHAAAVLGSQCGHVFYLARRLNFDWHKAWKAHEAELCSCGHRRADHAYNACQCYQCKCREYSAVCAPPASPDPPLGSETPAPANQSATVARKPPTTATDACSNKKEGPETT